MASASGLDRLLRVTVKGVIPLAYGFWEKALRANHQQQQKNNVTEPDAPTGIKTKPDLLRDTQQQGADQSAPERTHATNDD
jgi:hypothetical protein